ncbi:MAG TPA: hypothetical protein PK440_01910 [Candidatus Accumulibacter phosphatis]|nr:MAG: hypothetical protein AW07_02917 [Candidatus Accumulibacter sp. SK-11]HAY29243.1 hypothetical protein [Accumulibacter sp.]HCN67878.1 hypothetical protein [Accumulibacter sp.]HRL74539.1 hypothetical protein [Candidatus Accumulibacter phosphatis]HRQ93756.1 hypothetical protein [Candidatus Accumulibacter phosphatis]
MSSGFTESVVEQPVLAWIESTGWRIRNGTGIAPGKPAARSDAYGQVALARRSRESLLPLACGDVRCTAAARLTGRTL